MKKSLLQENHPVFSEDYENLKDHDQFIYLSTSGAFFAIKINLDYSAFINGEGKFILAEKYKNCLSIGSGYIREYDTFAEAEEAAKKMTTNQRSNKHCNQK